MPVRTAWSPWLEPTATARTDVSWPDFEDLRKNCNLVEALIAEHISGTTLSIGDRAERATGSVVSANYFDALGIHPILGRAFEPGEDTGRNAHPVTVISYQTWRDRYHGDPAIIGKPQILNGVKHTIIGVAPEGFYGTFVGYSFQFWVPASMEEVFGGGTYKLENRGARWVEGFAILKPGVTIEQAQAEMSAVAGRLESAYPDTNRGRGIRLYPLWQTPFNGAGTLLPTLRVSLVVAGFVLLIACANVGNLLLVRSLARRHEMTVRLSIGAGRLRLLRQLLTEGLILSVAAAAGGMIAREPGPQRHRPAVPHTTRRDRESSRRNRSARARAKRGGVPDLDCPVRIDSRHSGQQDRPGRRHEIRFRQRGGRSRAHVDPIQPGAVQVSLSFVLLVGAGILLKSLQAMRSSDPGFSTSVITTGIDMTAAGYDQARIRNFQDQLVDRLQSLGGVESVSWTRLPPFSYGMYSSSPIAVDGFVSQPGEQPVVEYSEIGPAWLSTMGIPLVSGREFTRSDNETARPVAVVNEAMAVQYWRGEDPIGKRIQVKGQWAEVVGVAKNSKYRSLIEPTRPFFYVPMRQSLRGQSLEIRTALGPEAMAHALTREIQAIDANLAPSEVITMREQVDRMSWPQRTAVTLLADFSLNRAPAGGHRIIWRDVLRSFAEQARTGTADGAGRQASDLLRLVMTHGLSADRRRQ